ncbi:PAS domain S-box-containing protein [Desulfobotulus alkaliphilus]|uniref:histidine kinase n=1 Tax=Desulfobotulus alkaliphilus TaxID=622671 RepID=A0A562S4N6_9BACT|nr:PAS domain S-box protein [Desulfobotulus alkaliphilus]TWI75680.1 PAS domain S-box-containing protein [Desulfobotulus alkaliphilus]
MKNVTRPKNFIMGFFCTFFLIFLPMISPAMPPQTEKDERAQAARTAQRLESILKSAPAGIGMVENRVMTDVNDYILNLTGYSRQELIGKHARMLYPSQEEFDFVGREKYRQIALKGTGSVETRWLCKNGDIRHIILSSTPLDIENPGAGVTFTVLDITGRKEAETKLLESEERFRSLFEGNTAVMLLIKPETGDILDANPAAIDYYGWSRSTLTRMRIQDINTFSPEEVQQEMQKAAANARNHFEFRHQRADGSIRDVAVFSSGVHIGSEKLLFSIIHDITDRKEAEASLLSRTRWFLTGIAAFALVLMGLSSGLLLSLRQQRKAQQALETSEESLKRQNNVLNALLNNLSSGVFMVEAPGGRPLIANPMAQKLLGAGVLPEINRRNISEMYRAHRPGSTEPYPVDEMPIIRGMKGENSHIDDMIVERPDGSEVWLEVFGTPIRNDAGEIWASLVHFQDITERKEAEAEREKLHAQLAQAQKMESVGRLAGGVAHDFNNMLGVILGHADLALSLLEPEDAPYPDLEEIRKAALRSADLTRQLLGFARRQTIAPEILNLNNTVEEMLKMLRRLIGEDIDLMWKPAEHIWTVRLDPSQVDQILANLCVNARDAITGVGKITIETANTSFGTSYCASHAGFIPGDYVMLAVSDSGSGMDAETLSHVFEPFFTTKEMGKGTGLGLATVYGIIKQNMGFVNIYSEPGQGTSFKIYIPRHGEAADTVPDKKNAPAETRGTETILLVEDEPMLLDVTRTMLENSGYTVLSAGSPGEAIQLARECEESIALLLTDVVMPEMNGRDLAEKLKALHPSMDQLFMSGYTANVIARQGVLKEGVHFIQKPFSGRELAGEIREILG